MMLTVHPGDPRDPEAAALLHESHALMQRLFQPEENHFLSLDELAAPDIRFFVAKDRDRIVGTGALAIREGYGEVKSMFTAEAARGKGAAALILDAIEAEARRLSLTWLRLETGDLLHAAHKLYASKGFTPCGPFGGYAANKTSLFMEKPLT